MIEQSKLKAGTLTLDALPFATQATNVRLTPSVDENGDAVEVLSGESLGADETTKWVLAIEAIQDFDDPQGFVNFCFDNADQAVPFTWEPNATAGGASFNGSCTIRAVEIGGPVNTRNSTEAEFPVIGTPARTFRPIA